MSKLKRMVLGDSSELEGVSRPLFFGSVSIRASVFSSKYLVSQFPSENRIIGVPDAYYSKNKSGFLSHIDAYLEKTGFFMTDVEFRPRGWFGLLPRRVKGMLYVEGKNIK